MFENFDVIVEKFEKAIRLLEEESKNDPESEPYKSKYAAKKIFASMKSDLKKVQDDNESNEDDKTIKILSAVLYYYIGVICVETAELSQGEEHLSKCLECVKDFELDPKCIMVCMSALNQVGLLWSDRGQPERSREYLRRAESIYRQFSEFTSGSQILFHMTDLFSTAPEPQNPEAVAQKLENVFTHTLYYLAQVETSLGNNELAATYCHSTLKRQLESKEYDPIDWALNAATLSQFFLSKDDYPTARHHLACAMYVLEQYESELGSKEGSSEELEGKWESLRHRKADVARSWASFGQVLLSCSKDKLMEKANEDLAENMENLSTGETDTKSETSGTEKDVATTEPEQSMLFQSLEVTAFEQQITKGLVLDFSQARGVFLNAKKWMEEAQKYYTIEDHASDFVHIVQDMSTLYKLLIFFEPNPERQCRMHKRRVDLLDGVLKEVNPQYYLDICRQLQFELGEIHNEMRDIKDGAVRDGELERSSHALQKINHLGKQSIGYFQSFLDTFLDTSKKMPAKFPEELIRPALLAYFFMGRLYSKLVSSEPPRELAYLKKSVEHFQYLVTYCKENEAATILMKAELEVCSEMAQLLPMKMEKILAQN